MKSGKDFQNTVFSINGKFIISLSVTEASLSRNIISIDFTLLHELTFHKIHGNRKLLRLPFYRTV